MASSSGKRGNDDLFQAASAGNLDLFQSLLNQKKEGFPEVMQSQRDSDGLTVLHHAAVGGSTEIVRVLLEEGKLDVNVKDSKVGETPLHLAILKEHFDTAVYLLDRGANPNATTTKGRTPLHYAAEKGPQDLIEILISNGADVNAMAECGTPLLCAAGMGKTELVQRLLAHNADPNVISNGKFCALTASVLAKSIDCVKLLLKEAGADPNICGAKGLTPLGIAAIEGETEMIKCLLCEGADPNFTDNYGLTPVEEAVLRRNCDDITILFPVTSPIPGVRQWSIPGLFGHVHSREAIEERKRNAKERFSLAKSKGTEAFVQKDYFGAIQWYTEAHILDPTDVAVISNRSFCWLRLNKVSHAVKDAEVCVGIKPDWPKGYYRAGSAYLQLKEYEKATDSFFQAMKRDPRNKEIERAFREAMDARKTEMKANPLQNSSA